MPSDRVRIARMLHTSSLVVFILIREEKLVQFVFEQHRVTHVLAVEENVRSGVDRRRGEDIQRWMPLHQLKMWLLRIIS